MPTLLKRETIEMRTQKEIDAEIALLTEQRKTVRQGSMSDNRAGIDAQIRVLKEKMDNDDIYDTWTDEDADAETRMSASDAMDWMNGERDEKPSDEWKPLCA